MMTEVDFTDDLHILCSPWCEDALDDARRHDALALSWVILWNYTVDRTSMTADAVRTVCKGLYDTETDELVEILLQRRVVFFEEDNRLIAHYRVVPDLDYFRVFVVFADSR